MDKKKIIILEDDPDDRFITESILKDIGFTLSIKFVSESDELYEAVKEDRPHLIILDHNSKPDNGLVVLGKLKADRELKRIPVVILSDSLTNRHVSECYDNGAASVIIKPDTYEGNLDKIKLFFTYWMKVVEL